MAFPSRKRKEAKGETDRHTERLLMGGGGAREVKRQLHREVTSAGKEIAGPGSKKYQRGTTEETDTSRQSHSSSS